MVEQIITVAKHDFILQSAGKSASPGPPIKPRTGFFSLGVQVRIPSSSSGFWRLPALLSTNLSPPSLLWVGLWLCTLPTKRSLRVPCAHLNNAEKIYLMDSNVIIVGKFILPWKVTYSRVLESAGGHLWSQHSIYPKMHCSHSLRTPAQFKGGLSWLTRWLIAILLWGWLLAPQVSAGPQFIWPFPCLLLPPL